MDEKFGGVIWTKHAIARLREREIKQGDAWATWNRPDQSRYAKSKGAWIFYKSYPSKRFPGATHEKIEVVAKHLPVGKAGNKKKEWLIISVWNRPDYKKRPKKQTKISKILTKIFKKRG